MWLHQRRVVKVIQQQMHCLIRVLDMIVIVERIALVGIIVLAERGNVIASKER